MRAASPEGLRDELTGTTEPELTFVGGVERDVAAAQARSVEDPARFTVVPVEIGFHCSRDGFPDLLEGRMTLAAFRGAIRERWWPARLERITSLQQLDEALGRLDDAFGGDPIAACRRFFLELVWPLAEQAGTPGLVEHSPGVLEHAPTLDRLLGDARFVHVVRDGREVAAARSGDPLEAIDSWAAELHRIDAGLRPDEEGATYGVWPDRVRVVLAGADPGGWERGLTRRDRRRVLRRYRRALRELTERGVHCAPELKDAFES